MGRPCAAPLPEIQEMTLQQLRYALAICDCVSLNKASQSLYVAQPSLSSALSQLEDELGITIFTRTPRGVTPTAEGAEFLSYARQIYAEYKGLMDKYKGGKGVRRKFGV